MDHSKSFSDRIEEMLISGILGVMTLVTFANVVTRYGFNQNILWALELTVFLFGWLVLPWGLLCGEEGRPSWRRRRHQHPTS